MAIGFQTNRFLALAASCIALNLVAGKVANVLSLPVYLDSIGTIIGAALLPPWLALIVGLMTSILAWIVIHPAYLFYAGTQLTIAAVALLAMRLDAFERLGTAIAAGIAIAAAAAIVSAPVTVLLFGGITVPGATAINAVLIAAGEGLWKSVIAGSAVVESMDKTAAAIVTWIILRRLPARLIYRRG